MRAAVIAALILIAAIPAAARAGSPIADAAAGVADAMQRFVHDVRPPVRRAAEAVADTMRQLCDPVEANRAWPTMRDRIDDLYRRGQRALEPPPRAPPPRWSGIVRPREPEIDRQMAVIPPEPHGTMRIIPPPGSPGGRTGVEPR